MTETAKKKLEPLDDTTVMARIKALMVRLTPQDAQLVTCWFVEKYGHPQGLAAAPVSHQE